MKTVNIGPIISEKAVNEARDLRYQIMYHMCDASTCGHMTATCEGCAFNHVDESFADLSTEEWAEGIIKQAKEFEVNIER